MKIQIQNIKNVLGYVLYVVVLVLSMVVVSSQNVSAATFSCKDGSSVTLPAPEDSLTARRDACSSKGGYEPNSTQSPASSGSGSTSTTPDTVDEPIETDCEPENGEALSRSNCGIIDLLVIGINVLSAVAGIVIIASLMIAGFTYMTAQDDPGKVQKAKSRIVMTLVALTLFIFMYALLNFLVPGGVL